MADFTVETATRGVVKPLIGTYGKSGGGKTRSALILARGIVGPAGKITLIDTENRRGSIFADVIPGGYRVLNFDAPFSPARYKAAVELAAKDSDIVVVDSMTHEWDGEGGVLDMQEAELHRMAGDDWGKREKCKMAAWIKPKQEHKFFVQYLLRCPLPVICCLRAQEKTHMVKGQRGMEVVTDEFTTPIADPRFIFEMLINVEVFAKDGKGGFCHVTKITHEDLFHCLPDEKTQLTYEHGQKIAAWCGSKSSGAPANVPAAGPSKTERGELAKAIWAHPLIHAIHNLPADASKTDRAAVMPKVNQFLLDENYISDTEILGDLGVERLKQVIAKLNEKIQQKAAT